MGRFGEFASCVAHSFVRIYFINTNFKNKINSYE